MRWTHIDFYFNTKYKDKAGKHDKYLNPKQQVIFEHCIASIIENMRPYIKRKFYLYEPVPHCFLTVELIDKKYLKQLKIAVFNATQNINFIKSANINLEAGGDEGNGEDFLTILDAFTEAWLFNRQQKLTHIVHCCMEFIHQTREKEVWFYQKMLALYGGDEWR